MNQERIICTRALSPDRTTSGDREGFAAGCLIGETQNPTNIAEDLSCYSSVQYLTRNRFPFSHVLFFLRQDQTQGDAKDIAKVRRGEILCVPLRNPLRPLRLVNPDAKLDLSGTNY